MTLSLFAAIVPNFVGDQPFPPKTGRFFPHLLAPEANRVRFASFPLKAGYLGFPPNPELAIAEVFLWSYGIPQQ
jgi:hypothetical protein